MIKKTVFVLMALVAAVLVAVGALYVSNATPVVPKIPAAEIASPSKPYVVKLHAQWCPVCRVTKSMWSQIEASYGTRVNLVVFDFTNDTTTDASRVEAKRLGLDQFFEENAGWTGAIVVVDARTKSEMAAIQGSRDWSEYPAAIDSALAAAPR